MRKICIVTAARSEYGYLKWLMKDILDDTSLELQTIVTGGHLSEEQGYTINMIKDDGIPITKIVDVKVNNDSETEICNTMTRYSTGFTKALKDLSPDCLVVLGDRYELLPICSVAYMLRVPIVHLSGGDVTEGALDDGIRNAVTMLATYHFPGTKPSADNICRMRNSGKNVFTVGEPSLDLFNRVDLMTRDQLAENLNLDVEKKWVLCTLHSETMESLEYNISMASNLKQVLTELNASYQVVVTKANTDFGGNEINSILSDLSVDDRFKQIPSLGQLRYLSFMKQVEFVIGNSSSGIVETPFMNIPTINIGNRQKGRYQCGNVHQCDCSYESIKKAVQNIKKMDIDDQYYWGNGNTSSLIVKKLKEL